MKLLNANVITILAGGDGHQAGDEGSLETMSVVESLVKLGEKQPNMGEEMHEEEEGEEDGHEQEASCKTHLSFSGSYVPARDVL